MRLKILKEGPPPIEKVVEKIVEKVVEVPSRGMKELEKTVKEFERTIKDQKRVIREQIETSES